MHLISKVYSFRMNAKAETEEKTNNPDVIANINTVKFCQFIHIN